MPGRHGASLCLAGRLARHCYLFGHEEFLPVESLSDALELLLAIGEAQHHANVVVTFIIPKKVDEAQHPSAVPAPKAGVELEPKDLRSSKDRQPPSRSRKPTRLHIKRTGLDWFKMERAPPRTSNSWPCTSIFMNAILSSTCWNT